MTCGKDMRSAVGEPTEERTDQVDDPGKNGDPVQLTKARPTTLPARCVVGKTVNAVGARTNAKKMSPPIQTTSDSSMRKRRKDMTKELYPHGVSENWQLAH